MPVSFFIWKKTEVRSYLCLFVIKSVFDVEFFLESVNASAGVNQFLLTCKERMAFGTDFNADVVFCGAGRDFVAAYAFDDSFFVFRMYSVFHRVFLLKIV